LAPEQSSHAARRSPAQPLLQGEDSTVPATYATRFDELKATNQLPSPTGVALALLRLAESETTTAQDMARVLQTDPALSGRVLKIANSAAAGRGRPVSSVREAVTHLGTRMVRNVALGFSLVSQSGHGACRGFDYGGFWSRSLAMGVAAQAAAHFTGKIAPAEAFTCGLLAQVGRLALASIYPDAYSDILTPVTERDPVELCRLEREHFATDHNELSAALLKDWGLSDVCAEAVRHHERPEQSGLPEAGHALRLALLLNAASQMAALCAAAAGCSSGVLGLFASAEEVGIPAGQLLELCDGVVGEWQEWGRVLRVDTWAVPPFAELAGRALGGADEPADDEPAAGPLRIVAADDDPIQLCLLTEYLAGLGHTVHAARDGGEALRLVLQFNPQLVITDWNMPGMDGPALVKSLRQTKVGRQFYVIMLTGSEGDETQVEAFEAGADDYVLKPFSPKLLAARLSACARVVRLQEEVRRDKEELRRCMAELGVANRKLQQAALTDALTGLYNRRYALERLDQEWAQAVRGGRPLACLLIDLDHFKRVNDTHGHDMGDQVLRETASLLRGRMRTYDAVCRLGGEEFVVIAPGMDLRAGCDCAERLRGGLESHAIAGPAGEVRVTMSVGVAVRAEGMGGPADLLKAADQAAYAAKAAGRNQVRHHGAPEPADVALTALPPPGGAACAAASSPAARPVSAAR
jgi:diguanylate cyclase (GGDEF)-like protein